MSAVSSKSAATPAKATAPKPQGKAQAKPQAPAPKPQAPAAPAAKAPVPGIEASLAASAALGNDKKAESFRLNTAAQAIALGYKVTPVAPFDNVVLIEKGNVRFQVTYSAQDYVRKVEGSVTILPGEKHKWIRLNKAIADKA